MRNNTAMAYFDSIRQQFSQAWIFFVICLFVFLAAGVFQDGLLIASQIGAVLLTVLYYGAVVTVPGWRTRAALLFQPVLLSVTSSALLLYLEETVFKIVLIALLAGIHAFFLFHLRYALKEHAGDIRKGLVDSARILTHVNMFFLAAVFYAPLFYFNIRFALFFAIPFFLLSGALISSMMWIEEIVLSRRLLLTCIALLLLLEITLAEIWLPSSYIVNAFIVSVAFFLMYDWFLQAECTPPRTTKDRALSLLLSAVVVLCIIVFSQWR